jgi:hypothetical protein
LVHRICDWLYSGLAGIDAGRAVATLKRDKALRLDSEEISKLKATIASLKTDKFSLDNKQQESSTKLAELSAKLRAYEQELERRAEAMSKIMSVLKGE